MKVRRSFVLEGKYGRERGWVYPCFYSASRVRMCIPKSTSQSESIVSVNNGTILGVRGGEPRGDGRSGKFLARVIGRAAQGAGGPLMVCGEFVEVWLRLAG